MLNSDWLQKLLKYETTLEASDNRQSIGRAIIDGALVVYDLNDPPMWLEDILLLRDDNGNTPKELAGVTPMRKPRRGEYEAPRPYLVPMED